MVLLQRREEEGRGRVDLFYFNGGEALSVTLDKRWKYDTI